MEKVTLEDEYGNQYPCLVPIGEYNKIINGDYALANKYLDMEKEKKNRLLAIKLIFDEQKQSTSKSTVSEVGRSSQSPTPENKSPEEFELSPSNSELWSYDAVMALIASMATHIEDLSHPKKKKHVFSNISNDLISKKFSYTEKACYNKWRSLLRSYKSTKDKRITTGQGATRFQFFTQLDELLGDKPSNCAGNTLESFEENAETFTKVNSETDNENSEPNLEIETTATVGTKRKRKDKKDLREEAKERRHKERMLMEDRKLSVEERKCNLIEKFIEKI